MKKTKQNKYIYPKLNKKRYGLICLSCGKILVSFSVHDYRTCDCENQAMVDGGSEYFRYGAVDFNLIQTIEISPIQENENESTDSQ